MKLAKLSEIFHVSYGNRFDLNKMSLVEDSTVAFVGRTAKNNGVVANVEALKGVRPYPAGFITVNLGGAILESFVQINPFYTAQNIVVLEPKRPMDDRERVYYCLAIKANKFRYGAFGREANRTIKDLLVPAEMLAAFARVPTPRISRAAASAKRLPLNTSSWQWFEYQDIFGIHGGYYNKKPEECTPDTPGSIPFIGATEYDNGITSWHTIEAIEETSKDGSERNHDISKKIFPGNCITISNDGSVGCAFYQPRPFTCSHSVNPVYLKNYELNPYIALFLCTVIGLEKFRWAYGRKWRPIRMPTSKIRLPVTPKGTPDWQYMEDYIRGLPYSKAT